MHSSPLFAATDRVTLVNELGQRLSKGDIKLAGYLALADIKDYQIKVLNCLEDEVMLEYIHDGQIGWLHRLGINWVEYVSDVFTKKTFDDNSSGNLLAGILNQAMPNIHELIENLRQKDEYSEEKQDKFNIHAFDISYSSGKKSRYGLYIDDQVFVFGKQAAVVAFLQDQQAATDLNYWQDVEVADTLLHYYVPDVSQFPIKIGGMITLRSDIPLIGLAKSANLIISKSRPASSGGLLSAMKGYLTGGKDDLYLNLSLDYSKTTFAQNASKLKTFVDEGIATLKRKTVNTRDKHLIDLANGLICSTSKTGIVVLAQFNKAATRYFYTTMLDSPARVLKQYFNELVGDEEASEDDAADLDVATPELINDKLIDYPEHMTPEFFDEASTDSSRINSHAVNTRLSLRRIALLQDQVYLELYFEDRSSSFLSAFTRSHAIKSLCVVNSQEKELELDEEKSTSPGEGGLSFGEERSLVATTVLRKGVALADISQLRGITQIRLPAQISRLRLTKGDLGKSVNFSDNRVEILNWNKSSVAYYLFMPKENILEVHVLNHAGQVLKSGYSKEKEAKYAEGYCLYQHQFVNGEAVTLEIIYVDGYTDYEFPFSLSLNLDKQTPSPHQTSIYDDMVTFEKLEQQFYNKKSKQWKVHPRDEMNDSKIIDLKCATAGPMNIYFLRSRQWSRNFLLELHVKGPAYKSLHQMNGLLKLRVEALYAKDKAVYEYDTKNAANGFTSAEMNYWSSNLKSDVSLIVPGFKEGVEFDRISLKAVVTLPVLIEKIDLAKFSPGEQVQIDGYTLMVEEYTNGWYKLSGDAGLPAVVEVRALTKEDSKPRAADYKLEQEEGCLYLTPLAPDEYYSLYLCKEHEERVYDIDIPVSQ